MSPFTLWFGFVHASIMCTLLLCFLLPSLWTTFLALLALLFFRILLTFTGGTCVLTRLERAHNGSAITDVLFASRETRLLDVVIGLFCLQWLLLLISC